MKYLIVDIVNFDKDKIEQYDYIFVIGYSKDSLENLFNIKKNNPKIEVILPNENFDKAYLTMNKYIADFIKGDLILLSLFKLCKEDLFNIGMIMMALNKINQNYEIKTIYNKELYQLNIIKSNKKFLKSKNNLKFPKLKSFLYLFLINIRIFVYFLKGFFQNTTNLDLLLIDYPEKRVLGRLNNFRNSKIIDYKYVSKFVTLKQFIIFNKLQFKFLKKSIKYGILLKKIHSQSNSIFRICTLLSEFNPKVILASMDASPNSDIYSFVIKENNTKFGCYSHGFNYNFRTEYIYIPFDFYFVWSQAHLRQIKEGNFIKSNCKFFIGGSPFYENIDFNKLILNKPKKKKYDLLVIGEYYYSHFHAQPFNSFSTKKLANILDKYTSKLKICIRPRNKDEYYNDMYSILNNKVKYSLPKDEISSTNTVLEDIANSKLVLSVFSGGIHDSLLINTPVIQVNFQGIDEPKGFDKKNMVYYVDSEEKLIKYLDDLILNKLPKLSFDKNQEYFNDGKFDKDKVMRVLNEYI